MRPKPSSESVLSASSTPAKRSRSQRAVAQRALGDADVAREREQQRERVLGGRDDVRLGGVADDDARRGRRGDVDVVDADARAADHAQARVRSRSAPRRPAWPSARRAPRRSASAAREVSAGLELDDLAGPAQQLEARVGDRLGDDAEGLAHCGQRGQQRIQAGVELVLVGRAEVPEAQHLAGRLAAAALDDVAGASSTARRSSLASAPSGTRDRRSRASTTRRRASRARGPTRARARGSGPPSPACAPRSPRGPRRARGRARR